jgi:hypothetical protein
MSGHSGTAIRSSKMISAIRDGLNRGLTVTEFLKSTVYEGFTLSPRLR